MAADSLFVSDRKPASILERLEIVEQKVARIPKLEMEIKELQDQVRKLQKKIQILEGDSGESAKGTTEDLYNDHTKKSLESVLGHETSLSGACKALLLKVFDESYLMSHSITGRRGNTKKEAKPMMDERIIQLIRNLLKRQFGPHVTDSVVTQKIQNVQKVLRLKYRSRAAHSD